MFTEQLQFIPKPQYIRHGGAYDRGSADAWYARDYQPHYFKGASYDSERIESLTSEELDAYNAGYNNTPFNQKEYN